MFADSVLIKYSFSTGRAVNLPGAQLLLNTDSMRFM